MPQDAAAFASYVAAMSAFVSWEKAWEACEVDEKPVSMVKQERKDEEPQRIWRMRLFLRGGYITL